MTIWGFSTVGLCFFIGFLLQLITMPFTYFLDKKRFISGRLFRGASVIGNIFNPLWDFEVSGSIPKVWPKKTVCVSNHLSMADPTLLTMLPWDMKYMSKASVRWAPVFGWSMVLAGDVFVKRGDRDSAKAAIRKMAEWLSLGANVMIFPEGTRTRDGSLGPFKDGAFRLAIDEQVDLLPLALYGSDTALPRGTWKMGKAKGRVRVGKVISTKGMTVEKDLESLKARVREEISEMREQMAKECAEN